MVSSEQIETLKGIVGRDNIRQDADTCRIYGADALNLDYSADVVVFPASTTEVSSVAKFCSSEQIPLTPRGAGTGYTGGAVPSGGGVVLTLERMNQILEIDEQNLVAVVEPNVVTGHLQEMVERVGLFYPPDPASLNKSVIGGNVAECAGGPRAFKYGTTKRYVLGLQVVLPTGEIIRTGGKSVKNVVGYDLTQLLVGSEGTLAIVTEIILRLIPKPPERIALCATFLNIRAAVTAVEYLVAERVVPAALELIDRDCLSVMTSNSGIARIPQTAGAMLLVEVDGFEKTVMAESVRVKGACLRAEAISVRQAADSEEREELWRLRRNLSLALREQAPLKINHDVVVPKGRIPELFEVIEKLRQTYGLRMPSFGHVGDGNIHVNILLDPADGAALQRARDAERTLFDSVIRLEGSISGEHGIGLSKAKFLELELSGDVIALMRRVKKAFDPHGIMNPGKIFPSS